MGETRVNYEELWYLAIDGNEEAYNELVTTYVSNYEHFFYSRYALDFDYQEFQSEFRFSVYQAITSYSNDMGAMFSTYLHTCICNRLNGYRRTKSRRIETFAVDQETVLKISTVQSTLQEMEELVTDQPHCEEFLCSLTPAEQHLIQQRIEGYSYREIAEQLNCRVSRVHIMVRKLKTKAKHWGLIEKEQ